MSRAKKLPKYELPQILPLPSTDAYALRSVLVVLLDAAQRGERLTSRQVGERTATVKTTIDGVLLQGVPISDSRRTIAHLRERGFRIADEWDKNEKGKGFKRYWLTRPELVKVYCGEEASDE